MSHIKLTTTIDKPHYADAVRLEHVGWHPARKQFTIRFSLGYEDGTWNETSDKCILLENKLAEVDAKGVEISPADLQYDRLHSLLSTADPKTTTIEQLILEHVGLNEFAGTIL